MTIRKIQVIDTHTGGEPTRVVVSGGPELGVGPLVDRRQRFRVQFDEFRSAVVNEPRGSDVMVGALLVEPIDPTCVAGVIFFNNVGYLGMCGHGTIGVGVALGHLGRIQAGKHRLETPVGVVPFDFDGANRVMLENVASFRSRKNVEFDVPKLGRVVGDVAWGGNWFFLTNRPDLDLSVNNVRLLTETSLFIRDGLIQNGIVGEQAGEDSGEIDHIELLGPPHDPGNHGRSFVLCPGGAYDRSPCGTGTSAKIACLAADGKLTPGEIWRQESVIGSVFEASYRLDGEWIIPRIAGSAFVNGEATLLLNPIDPFCMGIRA